jgi:beta-galactosidase
MKCIAQLILCLVALPGPALTAASLYLDLGQPVRPVAGVELGQGTRRDPEGRELAADSRSFLRQGQPWIPIAGEFHYARYPREEWRDELLKMKAGGINTVSSYVFWIHHEEVRGEFDWSDRRSLRDFLKLCREVGLNAIVRMGPWCNGEARNGGFPDWVQHSGTRLRTLDPAFMELVKPLYGEIAEQMHGLLWKDGGPVIGVQVDNECSRPDYLLGLKALARDHGVDVPFYFMTGWNGVPVPPTDLIPLFGAYVTGFWDGQLEEYRKFFVYSDIRDNGDMGAQFVNTRPDRSGNIERYPYACIEIGGGMQSSYGRRIKIDPHDMAAMAWVKTGCGSNMPGYYMYHGGVNPDGRLTTLNATGKNSLPVKDYDFQAPLGACGELRPQYHLLRQQHLFLEDFGPALARMPALFPRKQPANLHDFSVLRWSVRSDGERGFLFFNNRQPEIPLPEHRDVQFVLRTAAGGDLRVPHRPVTIPSGSYGVWPVHLDCDGVLLEYATARPLCRLTEGGNSWYFFSAADGIPPELAFRCDQAEVETETGRKVVEGGLVAVHSLPGSNRLVASLARPGGGRVFFAVLSAADATRLWRVPFDGRDRLVLSDAVVLADQGQLRLQSFQPGRIGFAMFPAPAEMAGASRQASDGIFTHFSAAVGATESPQAVAMRVIRRPELPAGELNGTDERAWQHAVEWEIIIPPCGVDRQLRLDIRYLGDAARIYQGGTLLSDNYFNGEPFNVALWRLSGERPMILRLLVLPPTPLLLSRVPASLRPQIAEADGQARADVGVTELFEVSLRSRAKRAETASAPAIRSGEIHGTTNAGSHGQENRGFAYVGSPGDERPISNEWRREGDAFWMTVEVPPGAVATVQIPMHPDAMVYESCRPVALTAGVRFLRQEEDHAVFRVESGRYEFSSLRPSD